jgi:NAD(P)-dependent dehydrogenase (short-subunit alcohol dehydrogenase family)
LPRWIWATSVSGAGIQGIAGAAVYSASNGGVSNVTRALALERAPQRVGVNAVSPAGIETPMLAGQEREVAEVVWFLAQPAAACVTGATWSIDFGLSAGI